MLSAPPFKLGVAVQLALANEIVSRSDMCYFSMGNLRANVWFSASSAPGLGDYAEVEHKLSLGP